MTAIDDLERVLTGKYDLSTLSEDNNIRFAQLEERIKKLVPIVMEKQFLIDTQLAVVREKEKTILESHGIEYEYVDGPFLELTHNVGRELTFPTGRILLYNVTDEDLPDVLNTLRADLRGENDRLQPYFADGLKWMNPLYEFRKDLAVRYADICVITEAPEFPNAYCATLGYKLGFELAKVNMETGHIGKPIAVNEDLPRNELSSLTSAIRKSHEGHPHNTYIITHPSELLTKHLLSLFRYHILLPRWQMMHPHSMN